MGGSWQGGVAAATRVLEGLTELADFSPPAVLRLLKCMRGPPVRSPAEVERLVLVLNQAPPFSPKDLELVRKVVLFFSFSSVESAPVGYNVW